MERRARPAGLARVAVLLGGLLILLSGCSAPEPAPSAEPEPTTSDMPQVQGQEGTSLLGEPLLRTPPSTTVVEEFEANLLAAEADLAANPDSPDALIWVGRRLAYLGRYQDAIERFTAGVERFVDDARFLRHRGHRYLSIRDLPAAEADLARAFEMIQGSEDEVEPDGMPNAQGIPTSTLHSNIRYHLGLAHYLQGDFASALPLYEEDVELASNPDMRTASTYWLYLTLRRLGEDQRAQEVLESVSADLELIENFDYHRLLLYFQGALQRSDLLGEEESGEQESLPGLKSATVGYGVATFDLVEGRVEQAEQLYRQILDGTQWSAFGFLASEAEIARWNTESD